MELVAGLNYEIPRPAPVGPIAGQTAASALFSLSSEYNKLAKLYMNMGDDINAEKLYRKALKASEYNICSGDDNTFIAARADLGSLLIRTGRKNEAKRILFKFIDIGEACQSMNL